MFVVVGLAATVAAVRTRQMDAPRASTLAAVAAAVAMLAWVLLAALGVDSATIVFVVGPLLLAVPLLFLVGKFSERRRAFRD